METNNKNILIIGALGGMGVATSKKLINEGYSVYGLDIKDSSNIEGLHYFKCDITSNESIHNAFININKEINELYAIITLAGIYFMDSLLEISDEKFKKIIDINVLGNQRIIKEFFPLLKSGSKIVITTSEVATLDPLPFNGIYSMSKALLEKYAYSLRMEVNLFGIKVVTLRPGAVNTNLLNDSTSSLEEMVKSTQIHKESSLKFKGIVNSIESKAISVEKLANKISKILKKKKPKFVYRINNNFLLKIFNALPDHLQVWLIKKLLEK